MMRDLAGIAFLAHSWAVSAYGNILVNPGFETGSFSSSWTVASQTGSSGNFFIDKTTTTPATNSKTVGPESGTYYAVSDSSGPGAHLLSQSFIVPLNATSVVLSYGLFVNSPDTASIDAAGDLNYNGPGANEYASVSLLNSTASPFSTSSGVVKTFYQGIDSPNAANPYTNYSYDITSLVTDGATYTIRFAEVDNLDQLNMGVDNVSVNVLTGTPTPEPYFGVLVGFGLASLGISRSRLLGRFRVK